MRSSLLLGVAFMVSTSAVASADDAAVTASDSYSVLKYPETKTVNIVDDQFGVKVADPYRWLGRKFNRNLLRTSRFQF